MHTEVYIGTQLPSEINLHIKIAIKANIHEINPGYINESQRRVILNRKFT